MFFLTYILCYNFAKINHGDPHFKKNSRKTTPHLTDKILVSNVHDIFLAYSKPQTCTWYVIIWSRLIQPISSRQAMFGRCILKEVNRCKHVIEENCCKQFLIVFLMKAKIIAINGRGYFTEIGVWYLVCYFMYILGWTLLQKQAPVVIFSV